MMKSTACPSRVFLWRRPAACAVALVLSWGATSLSGQLAPGDHWFTAWSTSQHALGDTRISNATVRMIARASISGDAVRIRLDNTFGTEPVTIGRARVGYRIRGAAIAAGSNRPVTFNGKPDGVIPVGGTLWSDSVPMPVMAQQDLAVSLYVPGANLRPSQHAGAVVTSYRSIDGSGDVGGVDGNTPFEATTTALWWLKAIDVNSPTAEGTIVAFGDSITDGTCATLDAHDRWEDVLSLRIGLDRTPRPMKPAKGRSIPVAAQVTYQRGVINEGIGGNTVTREGLNPPPDSPPGIDRLDRDVLSHHGVSHAIVFMGTNDIRRGATASSVIDGLTSIVRRLKAKGVKPIGVTIIPRHNVPASGTNTGWDAAKTKIRNDVNQWIRTKGQFDAVLDFDRIVRDPANPDLMLPAFNCGDGIHPSPIGYYQMGASVDLSLFSLR
jgi:lysophospholipase L1-like esterase